MDAAIPGADHQKIKFNVIGRDSEEGEYWKSLFYDVSTVQSWKVVVETALDAAGLSAAVKVDQFSKTGWLIKPGDASLELINRALSHVLIEDQKGYNVRFKAHRYLQIYMIELFLRNCQTG